MNAGDSPLAWTPAEALVYTVPSDDRVIIYITEPGSLEVVSSIRLPASYQGEVITLDVSRDGSNLLMGYDPGTGLSRSGVLLLDLETLQVSVPAIGASEVDIVPLVDNISGNIRTPTWSPDGSWIMVMDGTRQISDPTAVLVTYARIFAVPANQSRTLITSDSPTEAISIRVEYPDKLGDVSDKWSADISYEADLDWVKKTLVYIEI